MSTTLYSKHPEWLHQRPCKTIQSSPASSHKRRPEKRVKRSILSLCLWANLTSQRVYRDRAVAWFDAKKVNRRSSSSLSYSLMNQLSVHLSWLQGAQVESSYTHAISLVTQKALLARLCVERRLLFFHHNSKTINQKLRTCLHPSIQVDSVGIRL